MQPGRSDIASSFADERPDLVVNACGQFQDYRDEPYSVIKARIDASVDNVDFADAAVASLTLSHWLPFGLSATGVIELCLFLQFGAVGDGV